MFYNIFKYCISKPLTTKSSDILNLMEIITVVAYFVFGTLVGSSLNVVILRYHNKSFFRGRSRCFSCSKTLRWPELIPIFSFLFLKGRCRNCRSKISSQYILVEISTGLLFAGAYLKGFVGIDMPIVLSILSILVAIFVYDLRHKIIPNGLVYLFIALSFVQMFINPSPLAFELPMLMNFLAGPILFIPFGAMWYFSKGTWMGLGDGKLALGIGWYFGINFGVSAIILAFWIGAAISLALLFHSKYMKKKSLFKRKKFSMKSEIPFAPFLILGFLVVLYFNFNLAYFIL